jgi:hypothetical protein
MCVAMAPRVAELDQSLMACAMRGQEGSDGPDDRPKSDLDS